MTRRNITFREKKYIVFANKIYGIFDVWLFAYFKILPIFWQKNNCHIYNSESKIFSPFFALFFQFLEKGEFLSRDNKMFNNKFLQKRGNLSRAINKKKLYSAFILGRFIFFVRGGPLIKKKVNVYTKQGVHFANNTPYLSCWKYREGKRIPREVLKLCTHLYIRINKKWNNHDTSNHRIDLSG